MKINFGDLDETDASKYQLDRIKYANPITRTRDLGLSMLDSATTFWKNATQHVFDQLWKAAAITQASLSAAALILFAAAPIGGQSIMAGLVAIAQLTFQIIMARAFWYLPLGIAISAPIFVMGLMMAVYAPLIPYIVFTFATIGWLIATVEAMAAAPLIALGITHPEGHDLMGKAEQSIMLLLTIFLRPTAVLLGFIIGVVISFVALNLLDAGFFTVMLNQIQTYAGDEGGGSTNVLILIVGFMVVYQFILIAIINQSFSLVYMLPAHLSRWLGGPTEQPTEPQAMAEVKGGFEQQADRGSRAGGEMAGAQRQAISPPQGGSAQRGDDKSGKAEEKNED